VTAAPGRAAPWATPATAARPSGPASAGLRTVTFGYDRDLPPLLEDIDLEIPAGARLALVGGSGSGKSTLARLIIGELQPWSGEVLLDGEPRLTLPRRWRTSAVAYVPQSPALVPGTVIENLTMFDDSITETDVHDAVRDACIEDAIMSRPLGYGEVLSGTGDGFSGGELQRLAIARALCRGPRLLVLDEATSALDPVVEERVEANLRARDCTCFVVAHRLSTVRDADVILVVDEGRIVQRGRYREISTAGHFAELVHG
jgi:ABC-type bacteriocin/lantibiotic exporter with double-glycine peptidase domain